MALYERKKIVVNRSKEHLGVTQVEGWLKREREREREEFTFEERSKSFKLMFYMAHLGLAMFILKLAQKLRKSDK